ncbi:MAG: hypothetical protein AAF492_16605 [Verrucomicrobiota bacterium]
MESDCVTGRQAFQDLMIQGPLIIATLLSILIRLDLDEEQKQGNDLD